MAVKARADAALTSVSDGATGAKGDAGASVTSVTTFWRLDDSQPATPTGTADPSGWGKTTPTVPEGYTGSLWVTYRNVISDGSTPVATWTTPAKDSSYEYAQRCWQLEDGTYTTARALKASTDEVSSTLSTQYTTTSGMNSAISSAVKQSADSITTSVSNTYQTKSAMSGYPTTAAMNTAISQSAESVKTTVAGTYQVKGDYATSAALKSTVEQTAEDLTAEFAAVVGGRNLLLGTSVPLTPKGSGGTNQNGGVYYLACGSFAGLEPSAQYTLSYTLKASASTTGTVLVQQFGSPWGGYGARTPTTTATRHSATFTTPASPPSTAVGVQLRMDNIPASVTVTLSDVQLERGGAATAWAPSPQDTSTLVRQSGAGVEVARKVNGSYTGTRALLGSDALEFKSADGNTTLASFGANEVMLGNLFAPHVGISTSSFSIMDGLITLVTVANNSATGPYIYGDGSLSLRSAEYAIADAVVSLGTTTSGSAKTGTVKLSANNPSNILKGATLTLDSSGGLTFAADSSAKLNVTPTAISCGSLKAESVGSATLVSSTVTAHRHLGWVVVRFDNYVPWTSAVATDTAKQVGTLAAGWRPPQRFKGPLYAGSADCAAQAYVQTDGGVYVYADKMPASQALSGYVVYPATQ